ncbi:MAG: hypothetical protein ACXVRZ_04130 [Gaiellaceae bacterium]
MKINTKRRWGYLVWVVGASVILVPELIAAFAAGWLPFTTISKMTGHLERRHDVLELVVVALLVWVIYSTVRVPPQTRSGRSPASPRSSTRTDSPTAGRG